MNELGVNESDLEKLKDLFFSNIKEQPTKTIIENKDLEPRLTEEEMIKNRELLRQRLRDKQKSLRYNKTNKNFQGNAQYKALQDTSLLQNMDMKDIINNMANKMGIDSKQKKKVKKQMVKMVEKMKTTTL